MSLFPRFSSPSELRPLFRVLDEALAGPENWQTTRGSRRAFSPNFDIKETEATYELHGELPGVEQKDISIEFVDPTTLVIKGHTEKTYEEGTRPKELEGVPEQGKITEGEGKENEHGHGHGGKKGAKEKPQHRYWVSERSVGEFQRSFSFPTTVDQDKVAASLKNGILSIVVPKNTAPATKKIEIGS